MVSLESKTDVFEPSNQYLRVVLFISNVSAAPHSFDSIIYAFQSLISSLPQSDPVRAASVQDLAIARYLRYILLRQQDDLEQSVLGFTEAIYHEVPGDPRALGRSIVQIFGALTLVLVIRVEVFRRSGDVKCCLMFLRHLHGQWHDVTINWPFPVTETLVHVLADHIELNLGDVGQDIEEMADLCDELLDTNISNKSLTPLIIFLARAAGESAGKLEGPIRPSEKVIGCLRKATVRLPDLEPIQLGLARLLCVRFMTSPSDDDNEEGMAILEKFINFQGPGDRPHPYRILALNMVAELASDQFFVSGKPEHLEQAISHLRIILHETSPEDPFRTLLNSHLSYLEGLRFNDSSSEVYSRPDDARSSISGYAELPPFHELTISLLEMSPFDPLNPLWMATMIEHSKALDIATIKRFTDMADIVDGIEYCRHVLASYTDTPLPLVARPALGNLLYNAFLNTREIKYINAAISIARDRVNTILLYAWLLPALVNLAAYLYVRFQLLDSKEDLNEMMELYPRALNYGHGRIPVQFQILFQWASTARTWRHPSVLTAYGHGMSLMQASLTFAPTLETQHSRFAAIDDNFRSLPLNYASYLIHIGRLDLAVETLEKGRSLLWSEIRGLQISIDQIRLADSHLAEEFAAVNRDLETLTLAFSSDVNAGGGDGDVGGMDPFGRLVVQQQKLLDDREKLISQIQALPSFETFLMPPSFDTLHSAASHGPIVIINHCKWRSDIIVLCYNSPSSIISTPDDFYARAHNLQKQLLGERRKGLDSGKYEEALRSVLEELFELVGQPVIKKLNELNIPEQSRVWWCPTSVFCSLPLHAMGPIPSDVGPPRYFLDLYIPSYIPSLSALIESRRSTSQNIGKPSILLVSQPDVKMPQALKEMKAVQAIDTQVTTLYSEKATPTAVLARLQDHQFAHIVCHGILEPGKPFEASFKLHRGKLLRLLDVVRSQLPNAEFAFLSACHTAELTDESTADEVLHLAAAMQFCGFRSVVGTMWAMADTDGWDLARNFYNAVFSDGAQGVNHHERTSGALRDAVVKLRRKSGTTLERWVNYVHYGA